MIAAGSHGQMACANAPTRQRAGAVRTGLREYCLLARILGCG